MDKDTTTKLKYKIGEHPVIIQAEAIYDKNLSDLEFRIYALFNLLNAFEDKRALNELITKLPEEVESLKNKNYI